MIPSGSPSPVGGAQPVAPSLLRTKSSLLGGAHNSSIPAQPPFSSLQLPRAQFNANEFLSNISNDASLLNHSFGNGLAVNAQHQGSIRGGVAEISAHAETNATPFASSSGSMHGQQFQKPSGNQHCLDHLESQQYDGMQNFQQQFSVAHCQQQKLLGGWGAMNSMFSAKLEPQMVSGDQNGSAQQLHALRNMGAVRMEHQQQQLQSLTNLAPVKTEHQHSDPTMLLQRQQPPLLHLSKQSSQAAAQMTLLQQQQRILQQQQQQIVNALPWQRSQLQQQLHQQSPPVRPQAKPSGYEPGACARRLTHYMYQQQHRPEDNNIEFWRKFVLDYFAPNAKKRWCVSLYGSGRQTTGVFPQDVWHCEICSRKPGRGFETTVEVLPRLCQIKYASGTLEELLYVDLPREYLNASGQIVLDYAKAIQESVFDQLRVVRDGQLRIIFNQDLKIASWEFCARRHEELIPRRLMIPQVSQLGAVLQKYTAQSSPNLSAQDLQNTCNSFIASARQLAKTLEVPLVNDLGYTKRYVRCLQISEVVNSMKDLIDYSKETGTGPMDSLINFPRGMNASSGLSSQQTPPLKEQQSLGQNLNQSHQNSSHPTSMQIAPSAATADTRNSGVGAKNSLGAATSISTSTTSINSILLQNSMISSKPENQMSTVSSSYNSGNTVQIPSASSSVSAQQPQANQSSPFFPSTSQFSSRNSYTSLSSSIEQPANQSHSLTNPNDSQSSVQQILQEILMSPHSSSVNSMARAALSGGNCLAGNVMANGSGTVGMEFGEMGCDITPTASATGLRAAINNNAVSITGRVGINHISLLQQDIGSRYIGTLGAVNGFNSLQFD